MHAMLACCFQIVANVIMSWLGTRKGKSFPCTIGNCTKKYSARKTLNEHMIRVHLVTFSEHSDMIQEASAKELASATTAYQAQLVNHRMLTDEAYDSDRSTDSLSRVERQASERQQLADFEDSMNLYRGRLGDNSPPREVRKGW